MEINTEKWDAGWLQWGLNLNFITDSAKERLSELKNLHPEWNFEDLAHKVRNGLLKPDTKK